MLKDLYSLLHQTSSSKGGWLRAILFLVRRVLEEELDRLWSSTFSNMRNASRYTQLICLKRLSRDGHIDMDPVVAEDIHSAWAALSGACHYHEYDLTPTVPELELWIRQVERLVEYNSEER